MWRYHLINKKIYFLFLCFSLLAIVLMGADYVCGHMGENPLPPNKCPLCTAFQSLESGHILLASLLLFGILPLIGIIKQVAWFSPVSIYLALFFLRAPPFSP